MSCTEIQEQLAWGAEISLGQRAHVAECPHCLEVATSYSLMDATVSAMTAGVPADFANRVMDRVLGDADAPVSAAPKSWLGKRWVQCALVYGGSIVAVINCVRFLAGVLTTSIGLGGVP